MTEAHLRRLLQKHVVGPHWSVIESPLTRRGLPDLTGCYHGVDIWLELKISTGWQVRKSTSSVTQVVWHEARRAAGGQSFYLIEKDHADAWGYALYLLDSLFARDLLTRPFVELPHVHFIFGHRGNEAVWDDLQRWLFTPDYWPLLRTHHPGQP